MKNISLFFLLVGNLFVSYSQTGVHDFKNAVLEQDKSKIITLSVDGGWHLEQIDFSLEKG